MGNFFKNIIGLEDEEDDDEELDLTELIEEEVKEKKPLFGKKRVEEKPSEEPKKEAVVERRPAPVSSTSRPVSSAAANTMSSKKYTDQIRMIVIKPQSFEECPKLVDSLKAKKPVIINLEDLETDIARKIFDFLSGATYALNGKVQKIANNIFVFSPENVDVAYNDSSKKAPQEPEKSIWG